MELLEKLAFLYATLGSAGLALWQLAAVTPVPGDAWGERRKPHCLF